jgi:hypothetical protein
MVSSVSGGPWRALQTEQMVEVGEQACDPERVAARRAGFAGAALPDVQGAVG